MVERCLRRAWLLTVPPLFFLQLSTPLLLACYVATLQQVRRLLESAKYIQLSFDGWSRTQGTHHILGYTAATFGMACFLDFAATGEEQVTAEFIAAKFDEVRQLLALRS